MYPKVGLNSAIVLASKNSKNIRHFNWWVFRIIFRLELELIVVIKTLYSSKGSKLYHKIVPSQVTYNVHIDCNLRQS